MAHAAELTLMDHDYADLLNKAPDDPETNKTAIIRMLKGKLLGQQLGLRNKS
jgi:hypothetical protein